MEGAATVINSLVPAGSKHFGSAFNDRRAEDKKKLRLEARNRRNEFVKAMVDKDQLTAEYSKRMAPVVIEIIKNYKSLAAVKPEELVISGYWPLTYELDCK